MQRWTLEEIGKLAGVSRSTVSRVINNQPNVRPNVRERVLQVISETGYHPNSAARSLASNRSRIIGLLMPSVLQSAFNDPYYPRILQAISYACNQHDYVVSLFLSQTVDEEQKLIQRIVSSGLVDGLLVTANTADMPFVSTIQEYNIPFVQIGRPRSGDMNQISYVDVDNYAGAHQATSHLIQQGHQRIAQIVTVQNTAGIDRDRGYRQALQERGLTVDEDLIELADFSEASGYRAMKALIPKHPTAVFVQSDSMAIGALRALREDNIRVPQDIAIVGFDDLPIASTTEPPLTTVRQPIYRTGTIAVETLIDILNTSTEPARHIILSVELVIRDSSWTN